MFRIPAALVTFSTAAAPATPPAGPRVAVASMAAATTIGTNKWICFKGNNCLITLTGTFATSVTPAVRLYNWGANAPVGNGCPAAGAAAVAPTNSADLVSADVVLLAGTGAALGTFTFTLTASATDAATGLQQFGTAGAALTGDAYMAICWKGTSVAADYTALAGVIAWNFAQALPLPHPVGAPGAGNPGFPIYPTAIAITGGSPTFNTANGGSSSPATSMSILYGYEKWALPANIAPPQLNQPVIFSASLTPTITIYGGNAGASTDIYVIYDINKSPATGANLCLNNVGASTGTSIPTTAAAAVDFYNTGGGTAVSTNSGSFTAAASATGTAASVWSIAVPATSGAVTNALKTGTDYRVCMGVTGKTFYENLRQVAYLVITAAAPYTSSASTDIVYYRGQNGASGTPTPVTLTVGQNTGLGAQVGFNTVTTGTPTITTSDSIILKSYNPQSTSGSSNLPCVSGTPVANTLAFPASPATNTPTSYTFSITNMVNPSSGTAPILVPGQRYAICFQDMVRTTPSGSTVGNYFTQVGTLTYYQFPRNPVDYILPAYSNNVFAKLPYTQFDCVKGFTCNITLTAGTQTNVPAGSISGGTEATDRYWLHKYLLPAGGYGSCGDGTNNVGGVISPASVTFTTGPPALPISVITIPAANGGTLDATVGPLTYVLCLKRNGQSADTGGTGYSQPVALINMLEYVNTTATPNAQASRCQFDDLNSLPKQTSNINGFAPSPQSMRWDMLGYLNGTTGYTAVAGVLKNVPFSLGTQTNSLPPAGPAAAKASSASGLRVSSAPLLLASLVAAVVLH